MVKGMKIFFRENECPAVILMAAVRRRQTSILPGTGNTKKNRSV
jgi:hypothetical protein